MKTNATVRRIAGGNDDYRLLIDSLGKATFDTSGTDFVRNCLAQPSFLDKIGEDDLLKTALVAQQHGLIAESESVYLQLHQRFPGCVQGWREYLSLLSMLGRREDIVRVKARALQHVSEDQLPIPQGGGGPIESGVEGSGTASITAPFQELRREEEDIVMFMSFFRGREDAFARQWVNRNEEKQGYVPVRRPLMPTDVKEHLAGRRTYGIYLLDRDSMVYTGVIDMDLVPRLRNSAEARKEKATIRREALYIHRRIATLARQAGLCCLAEVSGGKGYHFWFPVRERVEAGFMRKVLQHIVRGLEQDVRCFSLEIFPKQDRITAKGFGNLVKLPLGIHRGSGKPSFFVMAADKNRASQFEMLAGARPSKVETVRKIAELQNKAAILIHPRHTQWSEKYPELARLEVNCPMLGQLIAILRSRKTLSLREEKILLGTLGHLPRAGILLHHLFSELPEYNRPLLDYRISRIRGTVLGCKRIHSLMEKGGSLPCSFKGEGYPHPLRHIDGYVAVEQPKNEKVENIRDALDCLKKAIIQVERFM